MQYSIYFQIQRKTSGFIKDSSLLKGYDSRVMTQLAQGIIPGLDPVSAACVGSRALWDPTGRTTNASWAAREAGMGFCSPWGQGQQIVRPRFPGLFQEWDNNVLYSEGKSTAGQPGQIQVLAFSVNKQLYGFGSFTEPTCNLIFHICRKENVGHSITCHMEFLQWSKESVMCSA